MAEQTTKRQQVQHKTLQLTSTVKKRTHSNFHGFLEFIRKNGVVGLAIGFILGVQAKAVVDQMSASFINPLLGLVVGTGDGLTNKKFALTLGTKTAVFNWGAFLYSLINFVIIAFIVYLVFKWLRLEKLEKQKDT
jgi:large conductance mechanosensitive channel